jgi:hypothetical protein
MDLFSIGLLIIALAWIVQLLFLYKKNKNLSALFVVLYMLGVAILVIGDYQITKKISYFELITLVTSGFVFIKLLFFK